MRPWRSEKLRDKLCIYTDTHGAPLLSRSGESLRNINRDISTIVTRIPRNSCSKESSRCVLTTERRNSGVNRREVSKITRWIVAKKSPRINKRSDPIRDFRGLVEPRLWVVGRISVSRIRFAACTHLSAKKLPSGSTVLAGKRGKQFREKHTVPLQGVCLLYAVPLFSGYRHLTVEHATSPRSIVRSQ